MLIQALYRNNNKYHVFYEAITTKKIKKKHTNISYMYRFHIVIINYKPQYHEGISFYVIIIKKKCR